MTRALRGGLVQQPVRLESLDDLFRNPHHRIERGHRLLEDHADLAAAQILHRLLVKGDQVAAAEADRAGCRFHRLRQKSHDGMGDHRLSGAGLAYDAQRLAGRNRERNLLDGVRTICQRRQSECQSLDREDGWTRLLHHSRSLAKRGLSASFSPSPARLSASTVKKMARPGRKEIHQASSSRVRPAPTM